MDLRQCLPGKKQSDNDDAFEGKDVQPEAEIIIFEQMVVMGWEPGVVGWWNLKRNADSAG